MDELDETVAGLRRLSKARALCKNNAGYDRRMALGLTLDEMARAIKVSPITLMRWETDYSLPDGRKVLVWLDILEALEADQ